MAVAGERASERGNRRTSRHTSVSRSLRKHATTGRESEAGTELESAGKNKETWKRVRLGGERERMKR